VITVTRFWWFIRNKANWALICAREFTLFIISLFFTICFSSQSI